MSQSRGPATLQLNIWQGEGGGGWSDSDSEAVCVCVCSCASALGWVAGWLGGETRQGLKSSSFVQSDIYGIDGAGQC